MKLVSLPSNLFISAARMGGEGGEGLFHHKATRRRRRLDDSWAARGRQSIVVPAARRRRGAVTLPQEREAA